LAEKLGEAGVDGAADQRANGATPKAATALIALQEKPLARKPSAIIANDGAANV